MTTTTTHAPDTLSIDANTMGSHAQHWQLIDDQANQHLHHWLQDAVDDATTPFGLAQSAQALPTDYWLLQGPNDQMGICQIIQTNSQGQPIRLTSAYPFLDSPHTRTITIRRILACPEQQEAILCVETQDHITIHAFDQLYAINQSFYQHDTVYQASFSAWAYDLQKVGEHETLLVEDPAAIRHHRALNSILAENQGVAPDNLQEQLDAWQPQSADDEQPVELDLSHMAAYLFGETFGQEDEAWCQGQIIGKQQINRFGHLIDVFDVVILREEQADPLVIRLAYCDRTKNHQQFAVGDYIRGNIWMQIAIHAKK